MKLMRDTLRFECLASDVCQQVTIEGECALAGSMRDAVTVLSVQAQAHVVKTQALTDRIGVKGRVCFQVLYTQGDLTRIRSIETTCDYAHELSAPGAAPGMRVEAYAAVHETKGRAGSGRMSLEALLELCAQVYDQREEEAVADVNDAPDLCVRRQTVTAGFVKTLGEETSLIREEFDLAQRLQIDNVLTATGIARVTDVTGGNGRVGVSGTVEVRVLHQPKQAGEALVETTHELPFQVTINAQLGEEAKPEATAEVIDVVADSVLADKQRTMRVEAEVRVRLTHCEQRQKELLEDLYSTDGPVLEPQTQAIDICLCQPAEEVRESARIQAALPQDAPALETVLAAFAQPLLSSVSPAGRRMNAEGIMNLTLVYLPVDSNIPYAVKLREPFAVTFPVEANADTRALVRALECGVGPSTSDRVELRCLLALRAMKREIRPARLVKEILEHPAEKQEHGFVLVWPAPGESRWDTARRLRVPQEKLRPAGSNALMAFR